ncbi:VWFA and cache domain-containing protein 1-like [Apostichopus japonicus]|uniref:VWFA and cache domain-containing protein 1-like n=1 Tax=Stichopus japonicus TaxID=307972 RepID=UPI003AB78C7B
MADLLRYQTLVLLVICLLLSYWNHNVGCCLANAVTESATGPTETDGDIERGSRKQERKESKTKSEFTGINFNHPDFKSVQDLSKYSKKKSSLTFKVNNEAEIGTGVTTQLVQEAKTLSQVMEDIVKVELQSKFMQDTFDSLTYLDGSSNGGSQAVAQLAKNMRYKLDNFLEVLNANKKTVENLYKSDLEGRQNPYKSYRSLPPTSSTNCCNLVNSDQLEYDFMFGANVSKSKACYSISKMTLDGAFNPTGNLSQVFKRNLLRNPTLKWQYFSSDEGVHSVFPGAAPKICSTSEKTVDMRNSPMYAVTVRPRPKHVLIFIDRGYGIGENSWKIAKQAAEVALKSLCERDMVGVLSVGSTTQYCERDKCYTDQLAPASHLTKQQLVHFIRGIQAETEPTNHTEGLLKAFELIRNSAAPVESNNSVADSLILYISSGQTLDLNETSAIINTVINENRQLNNRVIVMTYALLAEVIDGKPSMVELGFLRDLAGQDNGIAEQHSSMMPLRQKGVMTVLNQISDLPSTVGRFYSIFRPPADWGVTYSLPYQDPLGKGLIISVTKPCFKESHLIGVIGLDISVADLLQEVSYFEEGIKSYAFMIDKQGYTVAHPSLTKPIKMTGPPLFANIEHFEEAVDFETVKAAMLRGEPGTATLKLPAGTSSLKEVIYSWQPVEDTPFILCTVSENMPSRHMKYQTIPSTKLYFHRLDILPAKAMCMNFKQLSATDTCTLMLAPNAFISPYEHFTQEETKLAVQAYMGYVNDDTNLIQNPGLKPSIKKHVAATSSIDRAWREQVERSSMNNYVVRRYLSTTSGVVWMYPGTLLAKTFDPSRRSWYKEAQNNPGLITLSSPYLDIGGAGYIVTISTTIFDGNSAGTHTEADPIAAVMGIDVTLQYLYKLLVDTLPVCLEKNIRCFIMDNKGYLVAHPHMVEPIHKAPVEQQHITHKEVSISNDLLYQSEFVQKLQCNSYLNGTIQRYYSFNTSFQGLLSNKHNSEHCILYKMTGISGTNAFVGIVNETCDTITEFCPCSMSDRICLNCNRMEQAECECPCECDLRLDPCSGDLVKDEDKNPACPGQEEDDTLPELPESLIDDLKQCTDTKCKGRTSWDSCFGVLNCEWCVIGSDNKALREPYCASQIECFGGVVGAATPYQDPLNFSKDPYHHGPGSHIGSVAGALLGIVTFLILVIYVYCHHIHKEARRQSELAHHGSHASVRVNVSTENVAVIEGQDGDDHGNPPGGGRYGQGNIALAAIEPPNPYHQAPRRGIRIWRRHPNAPSESDHGYSTMTPHEDSEYHYVEPEPIVVAPKHQMVDPPPGVVHLPRPESPSAFTSLLDCESDAATCGSGPITIPKIDPPPQTVLPRKSHRVRTQVQVHSVDTVF